MFIRFQVREIDEDSRQPLGVFQAAADLRERGDLSDVEVARLDELWT